MKSGLLLVSSMIQYEKDLMALFKAERNEKRSSLMEKFLNKMERKYGKYALENLSLYIVGAYAIGYVLQLLLPGSITLINLDPYRILHGQVWRIITWMVIPPSGYNILFLAIMLYFYYSIGTTLERTWGAFRYNIYIFSGVIFTVVGAIVLFLIRSGLDINSANAVGYGSVISLFFTTYYVNMSIFLAFAANYPEMKVLLYFIIPIKMKWMAYVYGAILLFNFFVSGVETKVAIVASLLNFILFFFSTRNYKRISPHEIRRKKMYHQEINRANSITKHKCAICGRTEKDDETLEFRFCSKCDGNYEYCQEHLFTHEHIRTL